MKLSETKILLGILAAAFLLRVGGLFHAFPLIAFGDESATLLASLKMLGTFSLRAADAAGYYYPALLSYVYLPFLSIFIAVGSWLGFFAGIQQIKEAVFFDLGLFVLAARFISVFFGVATVYLVYKVSRLLFNNSFVSLLASFFLSISFFHVAVSHFANTWAPQTFFYLLVLYWAIYFFKKSEVTLKDYILGAFLVSLAFGINSVGIFAYLWFPLVHFLKNRGEKFKNIFWSNKNFWLFNLALLAFIAIIYWLNPAGLNNLFNRLTADYSQADSYSSYQIFHLSTLTNLWFYLKNLFLVEPFFCLLFLGGSWLLWKRDRISFYFLSLGVVSYLVLLSPMTGLLIRYSLPLFPLVVIVAAYWLSELFQGGHKKTSMILLVLAALYTLTFSGLFDLRLLKANTLVSARDWILKNIPASANIQNYDLGEDLNLVENKTSIGLIKDNLPDLFSSKRKYLLTLGENAYPQPNFLVFNYKLPDKFLPKFDYIILSGMEKETVDKKAKSILDQYFLWKKFYPANQTINGVWPGYYEIGTPFNGSMFRPAALFRVYDVGQYIVIYKLKSLE